MGLLIVLHDWSDNEPYWSVVNRCFDGLQMLGGDFNFLMGQRTGKREAPIALKWLPKHAKRGTTFENLHAFDLFDLKNINLREFRAMFLLQCSPLMGRTFYAFSEKDFDPTETVERLDIRKWLACWNGAYGFIRRMSLGDNPVGYATSTDSVGNEAYKRSTNWVVDRRDFKTYLKYRFRAVHEVNFIRSSHLAHMLRSEESLEDWINAGSRTNGAVTRIADDMWAWSVPAKELDRINSQLRREDIVIC